ncbi:Vitellogenin, partial [Eufriesea mexicana]
LSTAGTVSADFDHGWKVGTEYTYLVRSRTLASLDEISDQHTGILMKALLTVQVKDSQTLAAKVSKGQYARVHMSLPLGWDTKISDLDLELLDLPIRGTPFEIKLKHGVIRDILVDRDLPTWEVNILKSIVSQLQVDSQGENVIKTKEIQVPTDNEPFGSYKVMEDSVGGKCEVLYDMAPLPVHMIHIKPELVPMPEMKGDGQHIDITKTKNFNRCDQRMAYHFGLIENPHWQDGSDTNGKLISMFSTSRIVISGKLKRFTIQSSSTTSKMHIRLKLNDKQKGIVVSRMNLTLGTIQKVTNRLPPVNNPESTGNLVYTYDNPFSKMEERRVGKNIPSLGSNAVTSDSVSSISSSEEGMGKLKQNLRGTSSSSESSSSISSSEENDFWQPKPTLQDAPRIPFLSEFVGSKGKVIDESVKTKVKDLLFEVAYELDDPSNIPDTYTLEKLSIVCSLLRTMNKDEIFAIDNKLRYSDELKSGSKTQVIKENVWSMFRDAITQTGTGPAFLLIKNWIEKEDIKVVEASQILMRLPKTVLMPTTEYVRAFFELVKSPKVINNRILHSVSIVAFGELLHNSQVNSKTIHNHYPVHTFGRPVSKHDKTLTDEYIPFLDNGLKNAVEQRNSPKIQSYIAALGMIGHPKILSVFEPYLEGKRPLTTFQKTLMVASLDRLADTNTKLARSVLYKIYLNTMESHEVRCTAVFLLMKTNPPFSMMQRMAEFTNYDTNKHVNSAVKSTLEDLAKMESPEWQELAKKASIALKLLTTRDYGYQYSHGIITEFIGDENKLFTQLILNYIGSDDTIIPRAIYLATFSSFSDFKLPPSELAAMISSVRSLMDIIWNLNDKSERSSVKLETEKLVEALNIIPGEAIPMEANMMINTKFVSAILPYDGNTIKRAFSLIKEKLAMLNENTRINEQKFASFDMTLGLPTETGLPFVYDFKIPILYKVKGMLQVQLNPAMMYSAKTDLDITCSAMIQGRIGFIAPFAKENFIAGIDTIFNLDLPLKLDVDVNTMKRTTQVKFWPPEEYDTGRTLHYSVVPYTAAHNILSLRPLLLESITQKMKSKEAVQIRPSERDKFVNMELEGDESDVTKVWNAELGDMYSKAMSPWTAETNGEFKANMYINPKKRQMKPIVLTLSYDSLNMVPDPNVEQQWTPVPTIVQPSSKDSENRRKEMLMEAGKGIKLAKSHVVDVQLKVSEEFNSEHILTVAWSNSDVENKGRLLTYARIGNTNKSDVLEGCSASQARLTPDNILFNDDIFKIRPKAEFSVELRYGNSCATGNRLNGTGQVTQSKKLQNLIKSSPLAMACKEQMKQGNKILRACQNAIFGSLLFNRLNITLDIESKEDREAINSLLEAGNNIIDLDSDVDTVNPKNAGKNSIDIKGKLSDDFKKVSLHIHAPSMDIRVDDEDISELEILPGNILGSTDDQADLASLLFSDERSLCMLDKTRIETFDSKSYPLRLGKCWHVVMTTYPRMNPEKPDEKLRIPEDSSVSILSRETEDGRKEVKILLGKDEIVLLPGQPLPKVKVNGMVAEVTTDMSYQQKEKDEVMFEIYKVGSKAIELSSDKFDVSLAFDGERILIQATDDYRSSIRGLCGNFDGETLNDFTGPQNCIFKSPEKFTASYALTKDQCEGQSLEIAKSFSKHTDCIPMEKTRHSNVINDIESGRSTTELDNWGYHSQRKAGEKSCMKTRTEVREINGKICFSTRPVVSCTPGCSATETKSKDYQFHCMEENNRSLDLKRRIQNGANPDLSQKSVDMSHSIVVPLACTA